MRKKILLAGVAMAMALSLAGCGDEKQGGNNSTEKTQNNTEQTGQDKVDQKDDASDNSGKKADEPEYTTFPSDYTYESDGLTINIDNVKPDKAYFYGGTSKVADLDYVKIGRTVMPDDGSNTLKEDQKMILSNDMTGDFYNAYYIWGSDACTYTTLTGSTITSSIRDDKRYDDYNLSKYTDEKTFSFGDADTVRQNIVDKFAESGIDLNTDFTYEVYYLDHATLQAEEEHTDMDGNVQTDQYKTDWSDKDDTYLFYFHKTYCGLRDFQKNAYADETAEDRNAQLTVMYNASGIIYFYLQNLYDYESNNEPVTLMDFDSVMSSVKTYYENIVDGSKREITSAELVLDKSKSGKNGKELIPVWAFGVEETPEDGQTSRYELRVNAETGTIVAQ